MLGDPYATLQQLKSYMGRIAPTDQLDDAELSNALASVSREIDRHCDRQFNRTDTASARLFRPADCGEVTVDDFYTITDLVVATDEDDDGVYETTWAASEFVLGPVNGIVDGEAGWPSYRILAVEHRGFPVPSRRPSLQVTARWGWTAVPAPVKQACLIMAAETRKLADAPFGVAGFGDFGSIRVRDNPMAAKKLRPYRRHPVLVG